MATGQTTTKPKTAVIPAVQLPTGAVPNPQSGTSQDTLNLVKKQAVEQSKMISQRQGKRGELSDESDDVLDALTDS